MIGAKTAGQNEKACKISNTINIGFPEILIINFFSQYTFHKGTTAVYLSLDTAPYVFCKIIPERLFVSPDLCPGDR